MVPTDEMLWTQKSLGIFGMFLASTGQERYAHAIFAHTGYESGTVYAVLQRFEKHGLLQSRVDKMSSRDQYRRMYRLTPAGLELGNQIRRSLAGIVSAAA